MGFETTTVLAQKVGHLEAEIRKLKGLPDPQQEQEAFLDRMASRPGPETAAGRFVSQEIARHRAAEEACLAQVGVPGNADDHLKAFVLATRWLDGHARKLLAELVLTTAGIRESGEPTLAAVISAWPQLQTHTAAAWAALANRMAQLRQQVTI